MEILRHRFIRNQILKIYKYNTAFKTKKVAIYKRDTKIDNQTGGRQLKLFVPTSYTRILTYSYEQKNIFLIASVTLLQYDAVVWSH